MGRKKQTDRLSKTLTVICFFSSVSGIAAFFSHLEGRDTAVLRGQYAYCCLLHDYHDSHALLLSINQSNQASKQDRITYTATPFNTTGPQSMKDRKHAWSSRQ